MNGGSVSQALSTRRLPLPQHIIEKILRYALQVPRQGIGMPQGFNPLYPAVLQELPIGVFYSEVTIAQMARDIIFSENRVILTDGMTIISRWLGRQSTDLLQRIQRLDLHIDLRSPGSVPQADWNEVVGFVAEKFDLPKLNLSINAAHFSDDLFDGSADFDWLTKEFAETMRPFKQRKEAFSKLHAFFVFWPKFRPLEAVAEKSIMGKAYDSSTLGKIDLSERDCRMPHGWEWPMRDADGFLDKDYLYYMEHERTFMWDVALDPEVRPRHPSKKELHKGQNKRVNRKQKNQSRA